LDDPKGTSVAWLKVLLDEIRNGKGDLVIIDDLASASSKGPDRRNTDPTGLLANMNIREMDGVHLLITIDPDPHPWWR